MWYVFLFHVRLQKVEVVSVFQLTVVQAIEPGIHITELQRNHSGPRKVMAVSGRPRVESERSHRANMSKADSFFASRGRCVH